ncbi:mevalonate kinase [Alphaproteobacteria bacterium]|nr:mevalonate kinase [Alphaproteobacteria bacterium]
MESVSYAKWILSGEHTVVRGGKAVAFPLVCYKCSVTYEDGGQLNINDNACCRDTFVSLLKKAAFLTNVDFEKIRGKFTVRNDIPIKSGLGSSAAICRNVANIFKHLEFCEDVSSLARQLEDMFHGKSSGLDIAVAMLNKPIVFQYSKVIDTIENPFLSHLMLTYSGKKAMTSKCADIVKDVFHRDSSLAIELDSIMNQASDLCEQGIKNYDIEKLRLGINLGNDVFHRWGLCDENLSNHIDSLKRSGALAAKPIGSGLGGYVVSLWKQKTKKHEDICLTLE